MCNVQDNAAEESKSSNPAAKNVKDEEREEHEERTIHLDVAIVGGGITGLYAAYKIAKEHASVADADAGAGAGADGISKKRIAIFEGTERLGGIVKTVQIKTGNDGDEEDGHGSFHAELGPMRFIIEEQPLFRELIEELEIETIPFTRYENTKIPYRTLTCTTMDAEMIANQSRGDNSITTTSESWPLYQINRTGILPVVGGQTRQTQGDQGDDHDHDGAGAGAGEEDPFKLMMEILFEAFRPALVHSFPKHLQTCLRDGGKCMTTMAMMGEGGEKEEGLDIATCPTERIQQIIHNFTEEHYRWIREDAFVLAGDVVNNDDAKVSPTISSSSSSSPPPPPPMTKILLREVSLPWLVHTNRRLQDNMSFNYVEFLQNHAPFFHGYLHEGSAAEKFVNSFRFAIGQTLITIKHGVESIIHTLHDRLRQMGVEVLLNSRLAMIRPAAGVVEEHDDDDDSSARTNLFFHGSLDTISAKTTFLCIPAWDIKQLGDTFSGNVPVMLSNVNPVKLFKIFFLVRNPWWEDDGAQKNQGLDRVPAREIHYYTIHAKNKQRSNNNNNNRKGVLLVYGDSPSFNTWSDLLESKSTHHELRKKLLFECLRTELGNDISNIEESIAVAWRGEAGSTSSVAFLGTKMSCDQTLREAQAIALKGSKTKNIAIANGCFSDYCGFIEGGLRMALSACMRHQLIQNPPHLAPLGRRDKSYENELSKLEELYEPGNFSELESPVESALESRRIVA